jgi:iron only hydrogenase large subunit-like protein
VYDINIARHLALYETYQEFKERSFCDNPNSPIISSICPGWICYAEKTNGDLIIPHLSKVRSPQQIMGALIKELYSSSTGKQKSDIYHVALMPCFDKKLEASRNDFKYPSHNGENEYKDVDCVLTPLEFEEILKDEGVTLLDLEARKLDVLVKTDLDFDSPLTSHYGSASGGYAENILLAEASGILGKNEVELHDNLEYSTLRNSDFIELTLRKTGGNESKIVRRFAIVNGFRNIQTVVQRLKRNALRYDYIEIMACPSGCINGGAQCKPNFGEDRQQMVQASKKLYDEISKVSHSLNSSDLKDKITSILKSNNGLDFDKLLYTEFHPVPKMQNLTVSW